MHKHIAFARSLKLEVEEGLTFFGEKLSITSRCPSTQSLWASMANGAGGPWTVDRGDDMRISVEPPKLG